MRDLLNVIWVIFIIFLLSIIGSGTFHRIAFHRIIFHRITFHRMILHRITFHRMVTFHRIMVLFIEWLLFIEFCHCTIFLRMKTKKKKQVTMQKMSFNIFFDLGVTVTLYHVLIKFDCS